MFLTKYFYALEMSLGSYDFGLLFLILHCLKPLYHIHLKPPLLKLYFNSSGTPSSSGKLASSLDQYSYSSSSFLGLFLPLFFRSPTISSAVLMQYLLMLVNFRAFITNNFCCVICRYLGIQLNFVILKCYQYFNAKTPLILDAIILISEWY